MGIQNIVENTIPISQFNHGLAEVNDARLLAAAEQRMSTFNPSTIISQEQVDQEFGFSHSDYEETEDIEFE